MRSVCDKHGSLTPGILSHTPRTRPESSQLIIGFLTGASLAFTLARVRAVFPCFSAGSVSHDWLKLIPVYKYTPTWQLLSLHVEIKTETWAILPAHLEIVHVTGSFLFIAQFLSCLIPKHFWTVSKDSDKKINSFELEIQPFLANSARSYAWQQSNVILQSQAIFFSDSVLGTIKSNNSIKQWG